VPRRGQAVEKVAVGPVGGPKELEDKAKILQERRFQPLKEGAEESAKEFFNALRNSANFPCHSFSEVHSAPSDSFEPPR
jgi:hypothetical protein